MSIAKKIIAFLPRLVGARKRRQKRQSQARWERQIQSAALESMVAELGRQLGQWQKRLDTINDRCRRGFVLSETDLDFAKAAARRVEILTQQREKLQRGLAELKGSA
jgi:hypothetical protein